jgi:hypothetical protein
LESKLNLLKYVNLSLIVILYSIPTIPPALSMDAFTDHSHSPRKFKPDDAIEAWHVQYSFDQQSQGSDGNNTKKLFVIGEAHNKPEDVKSCYDKIREASEKGTKVNFFMEADWERLESRKNTLYTLEGIQGEDDYFKRWDKSFHQLNPVSAKGPTRTRNNYWHLKILQLAQDNKNVRVIPVDGHCEDVLKHVCQNYSKLQWNKLSCAAMPTLAMQDGLCWEDPEMECITLDEFILEAKDSRDYVRTVMTYWGEGIDCSRSRDGIMVENLVKAIEEDALNITLLGMAHKRGVSKGFLERMSGAAIASRSE